MNINRYDINTKTDIDFSRFFTCRCMTILNLKRQKDNLVMSRLCTPTKVKVKQCLKKQEKSYFFVRTS